MRRTVFDASRRAMLELGAAAFAVAAAGRAAPAVATPTQQTGTFEMGNVTAKVSAGSGGTATRRWRPPSEAPRSPPSSSTRSLIWA